MLIKLVIYFSRSEVIDNNKSFPLQQIQKQTKKFTSLTIVKQLKSCFFPQLIIV